MSEIMPSPLKPDTKDVRVVKVTIETAACHREHKFLAGDARAACHLGLKAIDFNICPNCVWFGARPPSTTKMLTGGEAMAVMGVLQTLKETHDPMRGGSEHPAVVLGAGPEPTE